MNTLLKLLAKYKGARYGTFILAGVVIGLWLGNQYPDENAKLWALPAVSLILALAGVAGGKLATADWLVKVDEALNTAPPGKTICGCEQGTNRP